MERLSSWTIETMQGYVIVTSGSNKKRREGRGIGSTDGRYTIPVDDSVEKMFVTINTAVEGTMGLLVCLWSLRLVLSTSVSGLIRGNQRLFSVKYLFEEANIA